MYVLAAATALPTNMGQICCLTDAIPLSYSSSISMLIISPFFPAAVPFLVALRRLFSDFSFANPAPWSFTACRETICVLHLPFHWSVFLHPVHFFRVFIPLSLFLLRLFACPSLLVLQPLFLLLFAYFPSRFPDYFTSLSSLVCLNSTCRSSFFFVSPHQQ